jgi:methionyl-tRNA formyltransferase
VRAFNPAPGAFGLTQRGVIRVWAAHPVAEHGEPGSILRADASGVTIACFLPGEQINVQKNREN